MLEQTLTITTAVPPPVTSEFDAPTSIYSSVPQVLKGIPQWCGWKSVPRKDKPTELTKPPFSSKTGRQIGANDKYKSEHASFEAAAASVTRFDFSGIGFILTGTSLAGIDFDKCVAPDGSIDPYVLAILKLLGNPYAEFSPSGRGLHTFVECDPLPVIKLKDSERGAEFYHGANQTRFLTVTGNKLQGSGDGILKLKKIGLVHLLLKQYLNDKFRSLWLGDLSAYGEDHSTADLALMGMLARMLENNREAMEKVFTFSGLGQREKWRDRADYRERTITKACEPISVQSEPVQVPPAVQKVNPSPEPKPVSALAPVKPDASNVEAPEESEPEISEDPLPEFPQITGSIAELSDALCPDIPREFKIMAAVTRVGLMLAGKVSLETEPHLQPRFYTCAIADKGRGKSAANNEVARRLNPLADYHNIPSVDSGPALVDAFSEEDANIDRETHLAKVLLNPDEMIDLFEKAKLSRDGRNSIFTELLRLFEGNDTGNRARKAGQPIELTNAALAIIGGATPEGYDQMWIGSRGASGGLQSRFTLVTTTAPPIPTMPRQSDEQKIRAALERIKNQTHRSNLLLGMTEEAAGMLTDWWNKEPRESNSTVRITDLVKRFLMVLAVTNDKDKIDRDLMTVGVQFGEYQIAVREMFMPVDSFSWTQAFENKIIAVHEKHGPMTRDRCRKLTRPERSPGGFGEFLKAYSNLVHADVLAIKGRTQRANKYGLL
jgi:hypothetical protein